MMNRIELNMNEMAMVTGGLRSLDNIKNRRLRELLHKNEEEAPQEENE